MIFKNKTIFEYGEDCIYKSILKIFSYNFNEEIIYIHNINFDGFLILEHLSKNKVKFDIFCNRLSIYNITIKLNDKKIVFKCSYKILPLSLKKIGFLFNIQSKLTYPYKFINKNNINYIGEIPDKSFFNDNEDYEIFKKNNTIFDVANYTKFYCYNDVIITINFLKNLKDILKIFKIKLENVNSAPSLALKIFEKRFNNNKIKLVFNNVIDKIARNSYYGGRCEVYANPRKEEQIFHFDFTGMYAQCMSERFPYGEYKLNLNDKNIKKPGIYWIEYESEDMDIPVLPHHRIKDGKLMFTNGKFIGAFWFEEILLFLKKGGKIIKILYSITFDQYDYVFKDYVNFFTELRKKSESYNAFGKLMINSMYGRLGMRKIDSYSFIEEYKNLDYLRKKIDVISYKELNEIILVEAENNKKLINFLNVNQIKSKNNIVLASCITSKARIKLYNAQNEVIKNHGRILYSDTDSIFAAFKKNVLGEKHGEVYWDPNKKDTKIKEALFFSPKSYALKYEDGTENIKLKGYNQKNIDFDEIKNLYNNNKKLNLKDYKFLNKKDLKLEFNETVKQFDLNFYDKRYFIKDKHETIPFWYENYEYTIKQ